ncbi:ATP-binding cassette sub-family C member Sur isoform X2 [Glossina fuscipes]|uniref:ATP-binding cassette sub-family C member Sur isoform X2 n=1 Tax=Glossina fuscipes TaxID=7396 RepID=A0A8U0WLA7_9MUSC|nr:ATP-binding cassette sub-family C member Sur isoform X2 [Glossina fuscipes]
MVYTISCDTENGDVLLEQIGINICSINAVKWEASAFASIILLTVNIYILLKWKKRCHKSLLTFHNVRAAVAIILLAINSIELIRALIIVEPDNVNITSSVNSDNNSSYPEFQRLEANKRTDHITIVIGKTTLANAWAAISLTLMLMWYHRVVELKKSVEFLYVSCTMSTLIFILRIYELVEIICYESVWELESSLQTFSALCVLSIGFIDGFTVYKERYRSDYCEDYERIGYKHTLATFYSKAFFWWLMPLLWRGSKKPLELEHLGQMRVEDSARAHYDLFLLTYKTAKVKNDDKTPSLWSCYLKSSWRTFMLGGLLKLFGDLFSIIGPLAIQQIVQYIEVMYDLHLNALQRQMNNGTSGPGKVSITAEKPLFALNNVKEWFNASTDNDSNHIIGTNSTVEPMLNLYINAATMSNNFSMDSVNASNSNFTQIYNQLLNVIHYNSDNDISNNSRPIAMATEIKFFHATWLDLLTNGWAIAWIVLLAALAQGALSQASTHILNMTGLYIKTSLQGLIYRKTLLLNSECINNANTSINAWAACITRETASGRNSLKCNHDNVMCKLSKDNKQLKMNVSTTTTTTTTKATDKADDCSIGSKAVNDVGAITNLMSEDTLNIMSFFWIAHYVWAIPLKIAVVMYLLYLKLGISALIGSFACILTITPLQFLIGKAMSKNMEIMAKCTDYRLKRLYDTFLGIKLIKLNAWDKIFIKTITEARNKELIYLNRDSLYWTLLTILTHTCTVLIVFITLSVYVYFEPSDNLGGRQGFTASRLFSALALFQQLTVPLLIFPVTVPIALSAMVSTKRLERFLAATEIEKQFEGIRNMARILSKSDASLDVYEMHGKSSSLPTNCLITQPSGSAVTIEKQRINFNIPEKPAPLANSEPQTPLSSAHGPKEFFYDVDHKRITSIRVRKELLRNTPYVVIRPKKLHAVITVAGSKEKTLPSSGHKQTDSWHRDSLLLKMPENVAVSVQDCKFSWNLEKIENVLYIDEMMVPKGKLTMIVGKSGSGKSSLLSALLMEMPLVAGDMIWNKSSTLAFVPQQPWLRNASIRENILFGEEFRPKRYDCVLETCALKLDIALMPSADLTMIGERGVNLSGGQRQRIAIARALYSSANVVIMDDPFSSLDSKVADHVFEQSIKKMLSKANRTVILVTQQLQLVHQADYLIVLNDGCLQASGSYEDIEVTHPHIIAEWNSIIAKSIEEEEKRQQQENNLLDDAFGAQTRTAKERWNLFRNVAKFALQSPTSGPSSMCSCKHDSVDGRSIIESATSHEILSEESDDDTFTRFQNGNSFKAQRSLSIVYSSRHLMYDIPLPIDECQMENTVLRSKRRTNSQSEIGDCRRSFSISNTSKELRQSALGNSYSRYATKRDDVEKRLSTQQVSPLIKQLEEEEEEEEGNRATDANLVADLVKSTHSNGGFQQFLQRMSTRKSYKEVTNSGRRRNRLPRHSADSGILSISEESSVFTPASMPPLQVNNLTSETNIERNQDSNSFIKSGEGTQDNPEILANTPKAMVKMGTTTTTTTTTTTITKPSWTLDSTDAFSASQSTVASTVNRQSINEATTVNDCERKYGQIPAEIYLLYLRASDYSKVFIFFIAALIWQSLRVYTDVWLQQWSDSSTPTLLTSLNMSANVSSIEQLSIASTKHIIPITTTSTTTTTTMTFSTAAKAMPSTLLLSTIVSGSQQYNNDSEVVAKAYNKPDANFDDNVVADVDERYDITYYFHIYAFTSCTCLAMAIISTTIGQWAGCKARRNLHDKLLQAIMNKSLHFFQVTPLGRILNRFSNDMEIIDKKIAATSQRLLQFSLLCLCAVLINVAITPWFILLTLPICASYYIVQSFYRCSSRELQRIENATNSPIISHLTETIQGVTTIRAYNQESRFMEILFKRLEANTISFTIMTTSNRWLGIALDCLGGVIVFVTILTALLMATIACHQKQSLEQRDLEERAPLDLKTYSPAPSLVGLVINYSLLIPIYLNWVVKLLADMETYIGSVERIEYYSERKSGNKNNDINVKNEISNMLKKTEDKQEKNKTVKLVKVYQKYSSTSSGDNSVINVHKDKLLHTFENNVDDDDNTKPSVSPSATIVTGDNIVKDTEKADDDSWQCHSINDDKEEHRYVAAFAATTAKTLLKPTNCITQSTLDDNITSNSNNNHNNNKRNNKNSLQTSTSLECNDAKRSIHCSLCHSSQTSICQQYIHPPISWPHRGDIYFKNISLRYEGQQEDVIKNLTLFIPAGQRVGICGRTGSGKSSLALSLFHMLQITSGSIYIDGIDISQIHPDEIRTRLSIIPQDVHLFSTTIRENLDPNGHYTDIELWDCLELAQLKEFIINKMPQGLDSELIDSGIKLSLGHRQLLCLARAILKRSMCLVLDEATSYLDISTERILLAAAHKAFAGRTIIAIAHRLDTIYDYDRIIVLENGEIISDDGRQQLQWCADGACNSVDGH